MAETATKQGEAQRGVATQPRPVPIRLPADMRRYVIERLAQFTPVSQVQREVEEHWGRRLSVETIRTYDATKPYTRVGQKGREHFNAVRVRYLSDISDVGIAHQVHRLRTLDRLATKAEEADQTSVVQGLLKQAAEEMGGTFTNQRTVTHKGGVGVLHLNAEDAKAELAQRLAAVLPQLALPCPVIEPDKQG